MSKRRMISGIYNVDKIELESEKKNSLTLAAPLMREIEKIEKQKALKMKMETFVMKFNRDFESGFQYMIESNLVTFQYILNNS